nr:SpoIIE family protein phosphatase [Mycobacterium sp. Marseille-P9652]
MSFGGRFGPIEWATAGRPLPGELVSGDQPIAVSIDDDAALFGVADGLGHGTPAAAAAVRAVDALKTAPNERLENLVQLCHRVLAGSRGVAMTLARVDFSAGTLSWTGVGNVAADLVVKAATGPRLRASARLSAGIVGYRIPEIGPAQVVPIRAGDLIIISTDGIAEDHLEHIDFAAPAPVIAKELLSRHAKETDDAMVLTARHRGVSI